ncbi:hypothetical protein ACJJH9_03125 [Microbulbifer sp. DLAB2-AF]|uniref:hypothetical protein n=1 Tax=Microbulbifer sp. DLAB2-AF TaxID=3243395 RepID=UPI004039C045
MNLNQSQLLKQVRSTNPKEALKYIDDNSLFSNGMRKSLSFYLKAYLDEFPEAESLESFISEDESAILYGKCPVIFLGSNNWALKRFETIKNLSKKLEVWSMQVNRILDKIETDRLSIFLIPEKDSVLRFFGDEELDNTSIAIDLWRQKLRNERGAISYHLDPLKNVVDKRLENYRYYDSHLLARDYITYFFSSLEQFGLISSFRTEEFSLVPYDYYADLSSKFDHDVINPIKFLLPNFARDSVTLTSGCKNFANPLRDTFQSFHNKEAPIKAKVTIFGDSHSSIYEKRNLTYLYANTFKDCSFYWDPMAINNINLIDTDYCILEISTRFLFG